MILSGRHKCRKSDYAVLTAVRGTRLTRRDLAPDVLAPAVNLAGWDRDLHRGLHISVTEAKLCESFRRV